MYKNILLTLLIDSLFELMIIILKAHLKKIKKSTLRFEVQEFIFVLAVKAMRLIYREKSTDKDILTIHVP